MKTVARDSITDETLREILNVETHHDHEIVMDEDGTLRWKVDPKVRGVVDKIGLNDLFCLFHDMGLGLHNKNSEPIRKLYRDIGYSLFGYWEVFYWEVNNENAKNYNPTSNS